jgi:hypothetical protein
MQHAGLTMSLGIEHCGGGKLMSPEEIIAQEEAAASAPKKVEVYREEEAGGDCSPPYEWKFDPDMAAPKPQTPEDILFDEEEHRAALCTVAIPKGTPFEKIRMYADHYLGGIATHKFTGKFLLVDGLTSMAEIRQGEKYLISVLEDPDRTAEVKLAAVRIMAAVKEMRAKFGDHLMSLAEKTEAKGANGKKRNLPPAPGATMINVPGQNPTVVIQHANSGAEQVQPNPQSHD